MYTRAGWGRWGVPELCTRRVDTSDCFGAPELYTRADWSVPELCTRRVNTSDCFGAPELYTRAGWGVPELCTRRVELVCTLACFASGGGPKVGRWGGRMADIEGTFKFTKPKIY